jgi:hypothetical protein
MENVCALRLIDYSELKHMVDIFSPSGSGRQENSIM